jgi:hypothetical protein
MAIRRQRFTTNSSGVVVAIPLEYCSGHHLDRLGRPAAAIQVVSESRRVFFVNEDLFAMLADSIYITATRA